MQVVLIHGLFSNGAFWLPYLGSFESFQVTLLSVDYAALLQSGEALDEVAERAGALIGSKPAHLITHSFGCWLGLHLKTPSLSRSFLCPTFAAAKFNADIFCVDIGTLTNVGDAEIGRLVASAVNYKARNAGKLRHMDSDHFYLPLDDPYFRYPQRLVEGTMQTYCGGHFDVSNGVALIMQRLASEN